MKNVLQRKDGTSIVCTQLLHAHQVSVPKVKLVGMFVALGLISLGILFMFFIP